MSVSRRSTPEHVLQDNWFHAHLSRAEAEAKLKEAGFSEGTFLVRDSITSEGDYVLSVVHNEEVIHYQIRKRGEDALFSLSAEPKVIHGLDQLVKFYSTSSKSGLQHSLSDYVPGSLAPPETRLHGNENLLHRATAEGNITVVTELLASGYRNLDSKNHDGQTALHIATLHGHKSVLEALLKYGTRVNVSDTQGYTALHYACINGSQELTKSLLTKGRANPTIRNELTQWVPLHDAAYKGHIDCVIALLDQFAPSKPRTPKNETPADLARTTGHHEVAAFLDSYPVLHPETNKTEWYHPSIDRKQALDKLKKKGLDDGTFLIRNSSKKRFYVLSMLWKKKGHHFEIEKQGIYFFIDEGPYHLSLEHLVQHYSRFSDGLPCALRNPVPSLENELSSSYVQPSSQSRLFDVIASNPVVPTAPIHSLSVPAAPSAPRLPSPTAPTALSLLTSPTSPSGAWTSWSNNGVLSTTRKSVPAIPERIGQPAGPLLPPKSDLAEYNGTKIWSEQGTMRMEDKVKVEEESPLLAPRVPTRSRLLAYPSNLRTIDNQKLYANNDTLRRVRHSKDNIPQESIKLTDSIGKGEFGSVFKGSYMTEQGVVKEVAIKALSEDSIEPSQSEEFLREAKIMMSLDHQCVVQLLGISNGPPVFMVMELVPLGSMLEYLQEHPDTVGTDMELPLWASQIACGMLYLQTKRFVHRDLAARNILLSSKYQTKISDFGLSRVVGDKNYYKSVQGGKWPIRWYAPECINFGTFSHASDVWSYGVMLWEMYSYGKQPFENKTSQEFIQYIEAGHRLPQPDMATNDVYDYMLKCWEYNPQERPGFDDLFQVFSDNPEYMNLTELLRTQDFQQLGM